MYLEEYSAEIPSRDTLTADKCPVQWALGVARAAREASDGKNVMGRDGMTQLAQILSDLTTGSAEDDDEPLPEPSEEELRAFEEDEDGHSDETL